MNKKTSSKSGSTTSDGSSNAYPIRAVERVCDILDLLQRSRDGVSLPETAAVTSLPKSSAFRYLSALEARGYVERDEESAVYRIGLAFQPHNTRQLEAFLSQAGGPLQRLRDDTGETTNLGTLNGSAVVHNLVFESSQMMRLAARAGERAPIHSTALGKAIAAELPQDHVLAILNCGRDDALHRHHDHDTRGLPVRSRDGSTAGVCDRRLREPGRRSMRRGGTQRNALPLRHQRERAGATVHDRHGASGRQANSQRR